MERNTTSLEGWINEVRELADHPQITQAWLRTSLRTIHAGLLQHAQRKEEPPSVVRCESCTGHCLPGRCARQALGIPATSGALVRGVGSNGTDGWTDTEGFGL